jgi:hypothetical protein
MGKGAIEMKPYPETHQEGLITIERPLYKSQIGKFGIQIARDGRIWICIEGLAVIRFKPLTKEQLNQLKERS